MVPAAAGHRVAVPAAVWRGAVPASEMDPGETPPPPGARLFPRRHGGRPPGCTPPGPALAPPPPPLRWVWGRGRGVAPRAGPGTAHHVDRDFSGATSADGTLACNSK